MKRNVTLCVPDTTIRDAYFNKRERVERESDSMARRKGVGETKTECAKDGWRNEEMDSVRERQRKRTGREKGEGGRDGVEKEEGIGEVECEGDVEGELEKEREREREKERESGRDKEKLLVPKWD